MKKKRKGFTLVELLVTIVLLGVIGAIIIYNMTSVSNESKENEYERYIATVKSASSVYADMFPEVFNELYVSKAYIYITLNDLVTNGLLDEELENPFTKQKISLDEKVKVNLDSTNGSVTFEYPLNNKQEESTIVAISDYVVWGEPYDCMRGAGSYELALADEDGNIIDLTANDENGVPNMEKYNFKCEMPDSFDNYNDPATGVSGLRTTVAGNYDIKYTWITESGTKKEATRVLRVLAKVTPSFKTNVADYDFSVEGDRDSDYTFVKCANCDSENFYQTTLNSDGTWNYMTYEPLIEGADAATTKFKISKRINNPASSIWTNVTDGYVTSFPARQVDDGDKTYHIDAIVQGHYVKEYQYSAEGYGRFKAELIIPPSYISVVAPDNNELWSTKKIYGIQSDTTAHQSPVGIKQYEYRLSNEGSLNKKLAKINNNLFTNTATLTTKEISILNGTSCVDSKLEYSKVFFRAINKDGYIGKWTEYKTHITNQITNIIGTNNSLCRSGQHCCIPVGTNQCRYTDKDLFIDFGGNKFVVLEKYADNSVLAVLEGDTGVRVSPLSVRSGYASQRTCDGIFYKYYNYYVANSAIINEATRWVSATYGGSSHLVEPAYGSYSTYTLTSSLISTYGNALYTNPSREAWLLDNGVEYFTVYLDQPHKHANESTTAMNAYFYYASGINRNKQYIGQRSFVRPIVRIRNLNICSGDGTSEKPYKINK